MNEQGLAEEHARLCVEYEAYNTQLKREWLAESRHRGNRWDGTGDVYEVMRPEEQAKVHAVIDHWKEYITPLAEEWWKKRGWKIVWPEDDSQPVQLYHMASAT